MWGIKSADDCLQHFLVTPSALQVLLIKRCRIVDRMRNSGKNRGKRGGAAGKAGKAGTKWEQWAWPDNAYGTANICNKTKSGNHDNDQQINTGKASKEKQSG